MSSASTGPRAISSAPCSAPPIPTRESPECLLDIGDSEALQNTLQQMLPEHAGGAFEIR